MMKDEQRILIAIDGSEQAFDAVRYVSYMFPQEKTKIVLFHVNAEVPESFLDLRRDALFQSNVIQITAWSLQIKKNIEEFMEKALNILLDAGFPRDSISIKIQGKKIGIARDILKESHEGYSAIVLGRSGISRLKDIIMGSIANKLLGKTQHIPLAVIGGLPETNKIIIGFDASEGAMKAVHSISSLMASPKREIMLCHVIRPLGVHVGIRGLFNDNEENEWIEKNIKEIEPFFDKAINILVSGGFSRENVHKNILKGKKSRAEAVTRKAEGDGYGTIAVGRRGLTIVEEFVIGRVSTKVLHLADEMAVWVI
ncbi:MAG: universal stress protein [Desulfobacterales bacterium]|nr:universal stress protein [Desulfobacterales bacterium]MBF0397287.1 universal stress protein [Desulfobacterales bacterium]